MADYMVPAYWQTAVDTAVSKIRTLQNGMGVNCVHFAFFTDIHYDSRNAASQYTNELGNIVAAVMDKCGIGLSVNGGDTSQATNAASAQGVLDDFVAVDSVVSPIGFSRVLNVNGNHDALWGSGNHKIPATTLWGLSQRKNTMDLRRVCGGDGSYYYVDDVPRKTRFIVLNTSFYDESVTSGSYVYCLGQEQIQWLAREAFIAGKHGFDVSGKVIHRNDRLNGWRIVIFMHVPPLTKTEINGTKYGNTVSNMTQFVGVVNAYCNKTAYQDATIAVDYSDMETAELIAVFSGHTHTDDVISGDLPCPVIITTCASNKSYDKDHNYSRTKGTDTETVVDFVSIDTEEGVVYLTRLGAGEDRQCPYR